MTDAAMTIKSSNALIGTTSLTRQATRIDPWKTITICSDNSMISLMIHAAILLVELFSVHRDRVSTLFAGVT